MRMLKALFDYLYLNAAIANDRRGDAAEALARLQQVYEGRGHVPPDRNAPIMLNAFHAWLLRKADRPLEAYDAVQLVVEQFNDEVADFASYSNEDLWFLLYWMRTTLARLSTFTDSAAWEFAFNITATADQLDLPKVRPILKRMFYLTEAWARMEDAFVEANRAAAGATPD